MKKLIKSIILALFILSSGILAAQDVPPPPTDDPKNNGGSELGGNAPIGTGITLLLVLGAVYGSRKTYLLSKKENTND